ncbi:MAG: hypothetical protein Q7S26_02915 [bacterium]|nr:hypothetical protein [bacterium]
MEENKDTDLPEAGKEKTLLDIDAILLPKKEVHTNASAQRINAGVLLEQEQNATLLPQVEPQSTSDGSSLEKVLGGPRFADKREDANLAPDFSSKTSASGQNSEVPPLQTYKDDIQKLIQKDRVSVVTIAAAEASRRSNATSATPAKTPWPNLVKVLLITAGVLFLLGALGLIAYFFAPARSVPIEQALPAPFITVDTTKIITIASGATRSDTMANLYDAKKESFSLGLVEWLVPVTPATSGALPEAMSAQTLLGLLAPTIPADLLRTIQPTFLLGVHSFDINQPFLILKVDSYGQAYSGMLAWERSMHQNLAPLFDYIPRQRIPEENIATVSTGSTTLTTGSSPQATPLLQTGFVDQIVANHDARVLQNNTGDIYFLWTLLDRNTIVITTNENTLREIISRATMTTIVPLSQ